VTVAYVGIGSNLDEPRSHVQLAFEDLDRIPGTGVVKRSSLYRSGPVGYADQPDFVNAVAEIQTSLPASRLLAELKEIEARHGRRRSFKNAPRTLDLDILLYGEVTLSLAHLTLPHPRMHERAFVLRPLLDLAPDIELPRLGRAADLLAQVADQKIEPYVGPASAG
jgi:2-amino-4-hydroxy-6-hydroxymethyldihydropteridine diphosphokinase